MVSLDNLCPTISNWDWNGKKYLSRRVNLHILLIGGRLFAKLCLIASVTHFLTIFLFYIYLIKTVLTDNSLSKQNSINRKCTMLVWALPKANALMHRFSGEKKQKKFLKDRRCTWLQLTKQVNQSICSRFCIIHLVPDWFPAAWSEF